MKGDRETEAPSARVEKDSGTRWPFLEKILSSDSWEGDGLGLDPKPCSFSQNKEYSVNEDTD